MMNTFRPPKWQKPTPIGYGPASEFVSGVAAPLLSGFSLTATLVMAQDDGKFRWPGAAMLAFTVAATVLVFSVQCGFTARQYLYSAADVRDWWPDVEDDSDRDQKLRRQQFEDFDKWSYWSRWARHLYNTGIVFLLVGLSLGMAPPGGDGVQESLRWAATALTQAAAAFEIVWIIRLLRSEIHVRRPSWP